MGVTTSLFDFPVEHVAPCATVRFFGLDYLRITLSGLTDSGIIESYLRGFSSNSPQAFDQDFLGSQGFDFQFVDAGNKKILLVLMNIKGEKTAMMEIVKYVNFGALTKCHYQISFYSAAFTAPEFASHLLKTLTLWGTLPRAKITRCDICMDIEGKTVQEMYNEIYPIEQNETNYEFWKTNKKTRFEKYFKIHGRRGILETFYLGAKTKNHKHFIRVYNKKKDSMKKGKFHLYEHYIRDEKEITRIEAQLNVESCEDFHITTSQVLSFLKGDNGFFRKVYKAICINKKTTCFKSLPTEFRVMQKRRKLPRSDMIQDLLPYEKRFLGYAKTLAGNGVDLLKLLRDSGTLRDKTQSTAIESFSFDKIDSTLSDSESFFWD